MQLPSIGRIVHVHVDPATNNGSPVAPAIIVSVHSVDCINVRVFLDQSGIIAGSVACLTSIEEGPKLGQWSWPPRV